LLNTDIKSNKVLALSYIAQSSIFDNKKAFNQIIQLPYIMNVTRADINKAYKLAINRLKKFQVLDKNYNYACKMDLFKRRHIELVLKKFLYKYKLSNSKDFYSFVKVMNKNYTIFTSNNLKRIYNRYFSTTNELTLKVINQKPFLVKKRLRKNHVITDNINVCKLVSLKKQRILESINEYYKTHHSRFLNVIKPEIKRYLKDFNKMRTKKVQFRDLIIQGYN
jgi:hypothetical protein